MSLGRCSTGVALICRGQDHLHSSPQWVVVSSQANRGAPHFIHVRSFRFSSPC